MTQILPAELEDIPQLVAMENQLFSSDNIFPRQFRYLMTKANGIIVKALQYGNLVGYMVLLQRKKSSRLRIYSIGVDPAARKQGIARRLISYAEKYGRDRSLQYLTLEVCENNESAIMLYERAGFTLNRKKDNYYEDGCSALQLERRIDAEDIAL